MADWADSKAAEFNNRGPAVIRKTKQDLDRAAAMHLADRLVAAVMADWVESQGERQAG